VDKKNHYKIFTILFSCHQGTNNDLDIIQKRSAAKIMNRFCTIIMTLLTVEQLVNTQKLNTEFNQNRGLKKNGDGGGLTQMEQHLSDLAHEMSLESLQDFGVTLGDDLDLDLEHHKRVKRGTTKPNFAAQTQPNPFPNQKEDQEMDFQWTFNNFDDDEMSQKVTFSGQNGIQKQKSGLGTKKNFPEKLQYHQLDQKVSFSGPKSDLVPQMDPEDLQGLQDIQDLQDLKDLKDLQRHKLTFNGLKSDLVPALDFQDLRNLQDQKVTFSGPKSDLVPQMDPQDLQGLQDIQDLQDLKDLKDLQRHKLTFNSPKSDLVPKLDFQDPRNLQDQKVTFSGPKSDLIPQMDPQDLQGVQDIQDLQDLKDLKDLQRHKLTFNGPKSDLVPDLYFSGSEESLNRVRRSSNSNNQQQLGYYALPLPELPSDVARNQPQLFRRPNRRLIRLANEMAINRRRGSASVLPPTVNYNPPNYHPDEVTDPFYIMPPPDSTIGGVGNYPNSIQDVLYTLESVDGKPPSDEGYPRPYKPLEPISYPEFTHKPTPKPKPKPKPTRKIIYKVITKKPKKPSKEGYTTKKTVYKMATKKPTTTLKPVDNYHPPPPKEIYHPSKPEKPKIIEHRYPPQTSEKPHITVHKYPQHVSKEKDTYTTKQPAQIMYHTRQPIHENLEVHTRQPEPHPSPKKPDDYMAVIPFKDVNKLFEMLNKHTKPQSYPKPPKKKKRRKKKKKSTTPLPRPTTKRTKLLQPTVIKRTVLGKKKKKKKKVHVSYFHFLGALDVI
jgi:hypothetical protein